MAKEVCAQSEEWKASQIPEDLYNVINEYYPDDITVRLVCTERFRNIQDITDNNTVTLVFPPTLLYNQSGNALAPSVREPYSDSTITFSSQESSYQLYTKLYPHIESYHGISLFGTRNSTKVCIAKALYPNIIAFATRAESFSEDSLRAVLNELGKYSLISDKEEYQRAYCVYTRENIAEILMVPYTKRKQDVIKKIDDYTSRIAAARESITEYEHKIEQLQAELMSLSSVNSRNLGTVLVEIDKVNDLKSVVWSSGTSMIGSGILQIKTEPIYCRNQGRTYLFGQYLISFNFLNGEVRFTNLDPELCRYSYWGKHCQHPHIDPTGKACLGNIQSDIAKALQDMAFSYAAILAISFLRSVNIADAAGRHVPNWPIVDENHNIIADSCEGLLRCSHCDIVFPEDESQAEGWHHCHVCGDLVCPDHSITRTIGDTEITVCPVCDRIGLCTCEVCGNLCSENSVITTYFGKKVCQDCCDSIEIIKAEDNDFIISNILVTQEEFDTKIKKCKSCGHFFPSSAEEDSCPYCRDGHQMHTCQDCGEICSDAQCVKISQGGNIRKVCMSCYDSNNYKSCINCMSEYPNREMITVNSELGIYQCQKCYKELLEE